MSQLSHVEWAKKWATTVNDYQSLIYTKGKLLQEIDEEIEVYVQVADDPEYSKLFADAIQERCEALQCIAKGLKRHDWDDNYDD